MVGSLTTMLAKGPSNWTNLRNLVYYKRAECNSDRVICNFPLVQLVLTLHALIYSFSSRKDITTCGGGQKWVGDFEMLGLGNGVLCEDFPSCQSFTFGAPLVLISRPSVTATSSHLQCSGSGPER